MFSQRILAGEPIETQVVDGRLTIKVFIDWVLSNEFYKIMQDVLN